MRVLFITQKVDRDDDLLGVYHEWIAELAKHAERVVVICLMKGAATLPKNVEVYSLGKERRHTAHNANRRANAVPAAEKIAYALRFYRYIWRLRNEYDVTCVHMNTVYVLLGWWLWALLRKPVTLWFAHYRPHWQVGFANLVVKKIITSVPEACAIRSEKVVAVGQGIDTEKFSPRGGSREARKSDEPFKILFLGRISPVKDLETLVSAVNLLRSRGLALHLDVVGEPTEKDAAYCADIMRKVAEANLEKSISFLGRAPNRETPGIYAAHDVFVNLTATGSFDKSILEAMACEVPVVVSNRAYERILPEDLRSRFMFREKSAADLAEKLEAVMKMASEERAEIGRRLREIVVREHNIKNLCDRLVKIFEEL